MKTIKRTITPALAFLLAMLMAVYLFPADVAAALADGGSEGEPEIVEPAEEPEGENPVDALFELTEQRTADTKYIKMSDGTVKALTYGGAVHRKDEEGVWQDIDNTLTEKEGSVESDRVSFVKTVGEDGALYTLTDGEKRISVSLAGAQPDTSVTVTDDGKSEEKFETKLEELSTLTKLVSSLRYEEILPKTDLEYILHGNDLKENIVINAPSDSYTYSFTLSLENLTAELREDGAVVLYAEDEPAYIIPAPYMTDAENEYSDAVSYTLEDLGEGTYTLTVAADKDWIEEEERAFPVTVDPTIDTFLDGYENVFSDLYTNTKNVNLSYVNQYLYVGQEDYDLQKAYIQVNYFPDIPMGSVVNSVYMWYYENSSYLSHNHTLEMRKVEGRQTITGITAGTTLQIRNKTEDYIFVEDFQNTGAETFYKFDITDLYREWETETTAHIVQLSLKYYETTDDHVKLRSCRDTDIISPSLDITYTCDIGLEDQYSYKTQQIGGAGTGYVSDHSGQLCLTFTDAVSDNTALPLSVSHVYNSQYAGVQRSEIVRIQNNDVNLFANMKIGKGFMLSTQTSAFVTENYTRIKYTDNDGTIHDLAYAYSVNGSHYYLSDNGALTAIDASSQMLSSYPYSGTSCFTHGIILKDMQNNCMIYYNGLPALFFDSNGNKVLYLYNTTSTSGTSWFPNGNGQDQLRRIVQYNRSGNGYTALIVAATLYYNNGVLDRIITPHHTTYYDYDGSARLETVSIFMTEHNRDAYEPTNTYDIAQYQYNANDFLTAAYDLIGEYGVSYTVSGGKYVHYEEFTGTGATPVVGSYADLTYEKGQTSVTVHGNGSDIEDRETVSVFDNYGRTVCSYTLDDDGRLLDQVLGTYSDENDLSRNRLLESTSTGAVHENLFSNSSFEPLIYISQSDGWTRSETSVASVQTFARSGITSLKIVSTAQSEKSFAQAYTVHSSGKICFSIYVNVSEVTGTDNGWVDLSVREGAQGTPVVKRYGSGSELFSSLSAASEKKSVWRRLWITANVTNGQNYTFEVIVHGIVGTLYFDDAQLEYSDIPTVYNALSSRVDQLDTRGWVASDMTVLRPEDQGFVQPFGNTEYVYTAEGAYNTIQSLRQKVRGIPGKAYTVSAWAKADALPQQEPNGLLRVFGIRVTVDYFFNEDDQVSDEVYFIPGNPCVHNWQYISGSVIAEHNSDFNIIVELIYLNNGNTVKYAGASLVESKGATYKYDGRGNLIEADKAGMQASTYTYDNDNRPTGFSKPHVNSSITYTNPVNGWQPSTVTTSGVTTTFTYDSAGNVTGTVMRPAGNAAAKGITSSSTYNTKMSKLTSSTDALGTTTDYVYYFDGVLKHTETNSVKTDYTYDQYGNIAKTWIDNYASVQYTYTGLDLTNITTGVSGSQVEYTFTYDDFGRTTCVQAGSSTLASYTYGSPLGELRSVIYGDPVSPLLTITYFYDKLGRVKSVKYNNADRFLYEYDGMGNLQYFTDCTANVKYVYEYDEKGVLLFEEQYTALSPYTYLQGQYYTYNEYGDLKTSATVIPDVDTKRETFTYKYEETNQSGDLTAVSKIEYEGSSYRAARSYDGLNRPSSDQVLIPNGSSVLSKTYSYRDGADTDLTTPLVSSLQYTGLSTFGMSYTYDALGNITHVYKNNVLQASYEYDSLGQLIRENNKAADATYVYAYDSRGNITAKRTHYLEWNTATANLSSPISTDSYTYMTSSDGMWGDVLKKYNNSKFSYDAIGNPTVYNNGSAYTFTWTDGRRLASGTKGTASFAYAYNANGLRSKKTVNGVDYDYYWNGTRLEAMTVTQGQNTEKLLFYYDADGAPYALKYYDRAACLWRTFLYVTNLQGDVVALIDAGSGSAAATYEYDAWGRLVSESISPLPAHALLQYNPLTYRGYIYDEETGFYYLQTRYYDPTVGRFINADGYVSTGTGPLGYNMFAYCNNNPVNGVDPTGSSGLGVLIAIMAIVAVIAVIKLVNAVVALCQADDNKANDITSPVEDQNNVNMNFGATTVAKMGCGIVATHNAILDAGGSSSLAEVTEYMQAHDLTLGLFGAYYFNVTGYLDSKEYSNELYWGNNDFDSLIKNSNHNIAILCFKYPGIISFHYVAIKYDSTNSQFVFHNTGILASNASSINDWLINNNLTAAFFITI